MTLGLGALWLLTRTADRPAAEGKAPRTNAVVSVAGAGPTAPILLTNAATRLMADPRWAGVVSALKTMSDWNDANPVCHLLITTKGMGGKPYADTEMFRFWDTHGTNLLTRIKVHLRYPNDVTFIIEKEGEDVVAYLPASDQLVEVDAERELSVRFGLDMQAPDISTFVSLLRMAFVETNGVDRALTFAFKPSVMNLPAAASIDAFTTLRIDEEGGLRTIEQSVGKEHHIMPVKYLGFEQEAVARAAPEFPTDKPVITGKAFDIALQEEIIKLRERGVPVRI